MNRLRNVIAARSRSEDGASAVEYGLLAAAVAAVIVVIVFAIGRVVNEGFDDTCTAINTVASCSP